MIFNQGGLSSITLRIEDELRREPGLSIRDLATKLSLNRQFMAGFLAALEEHGLVQHRIVGPAKIYFNVDQTQVEHDH